MPYPASFRRPDSGIAAAYFTPEVQQLSMTGVGTLDFNQQCDCGPWTPGLTNVQALHWGWVAQAARQRSAVCAPPDEKSM